MTLERKARLEPPYLVVDDMLDARYIQSSGSHVCGNQEAWGRGEQGD